jgi:hypothetical protein
VKLFEISSPHFSEDLEKTLFNDVQKIPSSTPGRALNPLGIEISSILSEKIKKS